MLKCKGILLVALIAVAGLLSSCEDKFGFDEIHQTPQGIYKADRLPSEESRRALILYSAGYNSLSSYLANDIEDLQEGYLPKKGRNENLIFIVSRQPKSSGNYSVPTPPVIIQLYKSKEGLPVMDTILTMNSSMVASTASTMKSALTFIRDNFSVKSYGMIFSSHASGWLPKGLYSDATNSTMSIRDSSMYNPNLPAVKSVGQDVFIQTGYRSRYYEMDIQEFSEALPMHFEYILFDACLMGGIEVAYELKDKVDKVAFSQAEVLADGFDYHTAAEHLIGDKEANIKGICEDYFVQYDNRIGTMRSATISLVDCQKLDALAEECKYIFDIYKNFIAAVNPSRVQRYYRFDKHWFYDMEDILVKSNIPSSELTAFKAALNDCIIYKAATPSFIDAFDIRTFSGFSMYLPNNGDGFIDAFYKKLAWNKATSLVK